MTTTLITSVHLFICILLIILVLLQQGKGADAGATFGGGGNTMFGAAGADNFLTRFTTVLACCFMLTSVFLGLDSQSSSTSTGNLFKDLGTQEATPASTEQAAEQAAIQAEVQKEIESEIEKTKANKNAAGETQSETSDLEASSTVNSAGTVNNVGANKTADKQTEVVPPSPVANEAAQTAPQVESKEVTTAAPETEAVVEQEANTVAN